MSEHISAEGFPPGESIRDELEARGWTQADLATIMGRPLQAVREMIGPRKTITPETARGLAAAFGTSAAFWMNLESAYRLSKTEPAHGNGTRRAKLYELAPINDLVRRKGIEGSDDPAVLEQELKQFFGTSSLELHFLRKANSANAE